MWPYDRNVSIALGVGSVVSAVACYYMYNNESGGGGPDAAAGTVAAADCVKTVNNIESKAWNISRFFGIGKALALATVTGGKVSETNNNDIISS
tara:strand:+ start:357 stop:638 length:282 start_codon:yes stop_codon:yes gene_type:complete